MDIKQYREANQLADLLDFEILGSQSKLARTNPTVAAKYKRDIAKLRIDLAKQEKIDVSPADPKSKRKGFTGAI